MTGTELVGIAALSVFWLHLLLHAADAIDMRRRIRAEVPPSLLHGWLRGGPPVKGLPSSDGSSAHAEVSTPIARLSFEHRGRALEGDAIEIRTHRFEGALMGGQLATPHRVEELEEDTNLRIWLRPDRLIGRRESHASKTRFSAALDSEARRPRGWSGRGHVDLVANEEVWFTRGFLSTFDPRRWLRACERRLLGFVVALGLFASAGLLAAAFPMDQVESKLGAALCVVIFLGVPALWHRVRESVMPFDERSYVHVIHRRIKSDASPHQRLRR
ncbi:MAG: hypothetical protein AAGF12_02355 [Myxococcota bacterium]